MGRPTKYTQEIANEICERIAQGEPLRQICRDDHMPGWVAVYDWLQKYPEFSEHFAKARDLGFDAIAEEAYEISNTPVMGEEFEDDGSGNRVKVKRSEMLGHRKLQIETRLKLLAKWSPKKYGDKQQVELSGHLATSNMTEDEIRAELAALAVQGVVPAALGDDDDVSDLL